MSLVTYLNVPFSGGATIVRVSEPACFTIRGCQPCLVSLPTTAFDWNGVVQTPRGREATGGLDDTP